MTTIGLIGTRDGVGTTTVAVNLAIVLKRETSGKVLFVDLDCDHAGDAAFLLGTKERWRDLTEVASLREKLKPQLLSGYLTRHPKGIDLVSFSEKKTEGLSRTELWETLTFLKSDYDTVVLDLGSRWNRYNTQAISCCSEVWLVANGDPVGLPGVPKKLETLRNAYYPGDRIRFLINGWSEPAAIPLPTISDRVGRTPDLVLPQDTKKFAGLALEGTPIVVADLRNPWTSGLEKWVTRRLQKGFPSDTSPLILQWPDFEMKSTAPSPPPPVVSVPPPDVSPSADVQKIVLDPERDRLKEEVLERFLKKINPKEIERVSPEVLRKQTHDAVVTILDEMGKEGTHSLPQDRKRLVEEVLNEAVGLGPLEDLLGDATVSEIMVNAKDEIYAERKGRLTRVPMSFTSERQMMRVVERIVAPIGRRVDESSPLVDARLSDGSRVNIIIPPLALKGPTITIRRFAKERLGAADLIRFGAMNEQMAILIKLAIEAKINIVVSGGTGTGKTTLLNVLSSLIPNDERIVTIEDAAELQLQQDHVVRLESRPPNIEGRGAIAIRDLVKNALRMRPDRIVVGECRGGEALDMLQAMNTGHDGSLTTLHANTPRDALARLETLVMFAGIDLPSRAIREQVAAAVQLILQLKRFEDGSRKIVQITEITGMEGDVIVMQDVFSFRQEGIDQNRKVQGKFVSSGLVPKFVSHLQKRGIEIPAGIFGGAR